MRTEQSRFFQKSCLALAIVSLSACATNDGSPGMESGSLIERASAVGKRSMEMGSNAWQHTREALGFSAQAPDALLDEVDLALMEEDAALPGMPAVQTASAKPQPDQLSTPQASIFGAPVEDASGERPRLSTEVGGRTDESPVDTVAGNAATRSGATPERRPDDADGSIGQTAEEPQVTIVAANFDKTAGADYQHEVTGSDTLWSIARRLTGDPANWQQIADLNDLSQDASVFAGQLLRIPRKLLAGSAPDEAVSATTTQPAVPTQQSPNEPTASPDAANVATASPNSQPFTLEDDETLWELAKRATGDATLWRTIAEHNSLTEQQITLMHSGQTIQVPSDIVESSGDQMPANIAKTGDGPDANGNAPDDQPIAAAADMPAQTPSTDRAGPPAADVTSMDDTSSERDAISARQKAELESIMVSGTYYPKAVYNKADFSSSLLMRVSPGTALKVAGAQGPWYKVETDKGPGYMHARDIR